MNKIWKFNRLSLRYKLIFVIFVIVSVPLLFIGYFSYMKSVETIKETNSYLSLDLLQQTGKRIGEFVEFIDTTQDEIMGSDKLQILMDKTPVTQLEKSAFVSDLYTLIGQYNKTPDQYTVRIYPINPAEHPAYMKAVMKSKNMLTEDWFQRAKRNNSPFWQLFLHAEYPGIYDQNSVSRVKRLRSLSDYRYTGVVVIDITENALRNYIEPLQRVSGQQLVLLDDSNRVYFHTDHRKIGSISQWGAMNDVVGYSKKGVKNADIGGIRYLVTFTTLEKSNWKLVSMIPLSELVKPVSGIGSFTIIFTVLYFLLSIGILIYITRRFTGPIHALVNSMRKVERGDFSVHHPVGRRQDEVGWLYKGFNRMISQISLLIEEVQKSEHSKKELEFQVLTHQINPHFLYNTLESIRWKAEQLHADDISEMVSSLGNLLRLSLNGGKEMTTVGREMDHLREYVNIVSARQHVPVRIFYYVDESLMDMPFLRLLLQPLVENAIQHGLGYNRESGKIFVKGSMDGGAIRFEIMDNGPGFREADPDTGVVPPESLKKETKGVGLRNVHERLRIYFGEEYGLNIRSSPEGTVVVLNHPILANEDANQADKGPEGSERRAPEENL